MNNNNNNNNNNYDGTYDSSFPIWWSGTDTIDTTTATTSDTITFTAYADGSNISYSGNILSLTSNTTWNSYKNYDMWPKGVQDPSTEFKYSPKWHILLGYKYQMLLMWD